MITGISQLLEKISLGEDSTVELKEKITPLTSERKSLAAEISAFANSIGGTILIGVNDFHDIVGIDDLDKTEKTVIEICHDSIEPVVQIYTEKIMLAGKKVLKVDVPRSLYVHKAPDGYFMRQGSSKREMNTEQLARLIQSRSQARIIAFDEQPVPNTDKNTLDKGLFLRFIRKVDTEDEENDLLRKRRILVDDNGNIRSSVAGLLMCSRHSDRYLYNSFVSAVAYRGLEKDANFQLDAKEIKGPLDQQIIDTFKFIDKYNSVSARKEIGREDHFQYSMKAVFEALVNAVIHRDYSKHGSKIRVFLFADRLEIYSPGALANTLTVEDLPYNQITRNEFLARLLSEIGIADENIDRVASRRNFLERRGEGVGIILRESEKLSGKTPNYKMLNEELLLTIFAAQPPQNE